MFEEHGHRLALEGRDHQALVPRHRAAALGVGCRVGGELEVHGVAGGEQAGPVAAIVHPRRGVLHPVVQAQVGGVGLQLHLDREPPVAGPLNRAGQGGPPGFVPGGHLALVAALGGGDLVGAYRHLARHPPRAVESDQLIDAVRPVADLHQVSPGGLIAPEAAPKDFTAQAVLVFLVADAHVHEGLVEVESVGGEQETTPVVAVQENHIALVIEARAAEETQVALHDPRRGQGRVVGTVHVAPLVGIAPEVCTVGTIGVHLGIGIEERAPEPVAHGGHPAALVAGGEGNRGGTGDRLVQGRVVRHPVGQKAARGQRDQPHAGLVGDGHGQGERVLQLAPGAAGVVELIAAEIELLHLGRAVAVAVHPEHAHAALGPGLALALLARLLPGALGRPLGVEGVNVGLRRFPIEGVGEMMGASGGGDVLESAVRQNLGEQGDLAAGADKGAPALAEELVPVRLVPAQVALLQREHVGRAGLAGVEVHLPETTQSNPAGGVLGIKPGAVAPVVRHAEFLVHDPLAGHVPGQHALGIPTVLGHPKLSVRTEGEAPRIHHALGHIRAAIGAAGLAQGVEATALGIVPVHLVRGSVAYPELAVGRHGQAGEPQVPGRDEDLHVPQPHHPRAGDGQHAAGSGGETTDIGQRDRVHALAGRRVVHVDLLLVAGGDVEFSLVHGQSAEIEVLEVRMRGTGAHLDGVHLEGTALAGKVDPLAGGDVVAHHGERPRGLPVGLVGIHALVSAPGEAVLGAVEEAVVGRDGVVLDAQPVLLLVALHQPSVRVQGHQPPAALGNRGGEEQEFAVGRGVAEGAVVGPPRLGGGLAAVGKIHAVDRLDARVGDAPPAVRAGFNQRALFVEPVPHHGVPAGGEGAARDHVANAAALRVLNDQGGLAGGRLVKGDSDLLAAKGHLLAMRIQVESRPGGGVGVERRVDGALIREAKAFALAGHTHRHRDARPRPVAGGQGKIPLATRVFRLLAGGGPGLGGVCDAQLNLRVGAGAQGEGAAALFHREGEGERKTGRSAQVQKIGVGMRLDAPARRRQGLCRRGRRRRGRGVVFQPQQALTAGFEHHHPVARHRNHPGGEQPRVNGEGAGGRVHQPEPTARRVAHHEARAVAVQVQLAAAEFREPAFLPPFVSVGRGVHDYHAAVGGEQAVLEPRETGAGGEPGEGEGERLPRQLPLRAHGQGKGLALAGGHHQPVFVALAHHGRAGDGRGQVKVRHALGVQARPAVGIEQRSTGQLHILIVLFQQAEMFAAQHDRLGDEIRLLVPDAVRRFRRVRPAPTAAGRPDGSGGVEGHAGKSGERAQSTRHSELLPVAIPGEELHHATHARHREHVVAYPRHPASVGEVGALRQIADERARGPAQHHAGVGFEAFIHAVDRAVPGVAEPVVPDPLRALAAKILGEAGQCLALPPGADLVAAEGEDGAVRADMQVVHVAAGFEHGRAEAGGRIQPGQLTRGLVEHRHPAGQRAGG